MKEIIGDYETFISNISLELPVLGIDRSELSMMDHVCYRVATKERYQKLKKTFSMRATLLGEVAVSGRNIATFEFDDYLEASGWIVPYIELPEPKEGSPYPEGLEHAEFVVLVGLERFIKLHKNIEFDHKGMDKKINPELGLKTATISVKFHEQPLGAVIKTEKSLVQI